MADHPTKEQLKKFWEWCGFKGTERKSTFEPQAYYTPDGNEVCYLTGIALDLNNLFKYAVPKLNGCRIFIVTGMWHVKVNVGSNYRQGDNEDPALALFWAIWEIIK